MFILDKRVIKVVQMPLKSCHIWSMAKHNRADIGTTKYVGPTKLVPLPNQTCHPVVMEPKHWLVAYPADAEGLLGEITSLSAAAAEDCLFGVGLDEMSGLAEAK